MKNPTRINYTLGPDLHVQDSKESFTSETDGKKYFVRLNEKEHKWYVIEFDSEIIAASGTVMSPHKRKIEAKNALCTFGISFVKESRNRNSNVPTV